MRQGRFGATVLGFVLATLTACNALGPSVDCGDLDAATCEQVLRTSAAHQADVYQIPSDVQPARVLVDATVMADGSFCPSYVYITWSNGRQTDEEGFC